MSEHAPIGPYDVILPGAYPTYVGPSSLPVGRGRSASWWRINGRLTLKKDPLVPPDFSINLGPFSVSPSAVLGKGEAFIGPAGMPLEDMARAIKTGDRRVVKIGGIE